jgi:signal transduction histidine kinase
MSEMKIETCSLKSQLEEMLQRNRLLQEELDATNIGLLALTMELENKNEEVQSITQQLWQVARMVTMGELAASIAHELNNPLATVSLRVESLANKLPPEDPKQKALQIISQEVERMGALVKKLLDFSRRGQRKVTTVDVCREIEHALELIYYQLRKNRITLRRDYQAELPLIHADSQELLQLFLNLFTNASDAMPQGGTLTVRVYEGHTDIDCVAIEIADTGMGIQPDDLAKVMDPFFTTKPVGKGTGLGLSICRHIVREHQGLITIASEVGKGATVFIKLPMIKENGHASSQGVSPIK